MPALRISALDLSMIPSGFTARDALLNTVDLAKHVEALGFHRFWVAEHHNAKGLACSAPEIVIGQIANATKTIRVGSGGIMLPNHSPLKVAEVFRVLSAFFPGRIDLGVGRAAGTDPRTARVLRRVAPGAPMASPDDFPSELALLSGYLDEDDGPRAAFATSVVAVPAHVTAPPIFVLGSSDFGGALAAKLGLGFAFAHHMNPDDAEKIMHAYRRDFQPSAHFQEPYAIVTTMAACADSDEEIARLKKSMTLAGLRFAQGLRDLPYPSIEEAEHYEMDADERAMISGGGERGFVGTPERVHEKLSALAAKCQADEIMIMTGIHDHETRKHSYELLARAFS